MNIPKWARPAAWGAAGGAAGAILIGFSVGGWVTGGTATEMKSSGAESAIVDTFTAICVTEAKKAPGQVAALDEQRRWDQDEFVIDAGWVNDVRAKYRTQVARACSTTLLNGMKTG